MKVPTGLVETLGAIRLWRRSVGRSEELRVTVDPLVLTGVLSSQKELPSWVGTKWHSGWRPCANSWMLTGPHSWTQ